MYGNMSGNASSMNECLVAWRKFVRWKWWTLIWRKGNRREKKSISSFMNNVGMIFALFHLQIRHFSTTQTAAALHELISCLLVHHFEIYSMENRHSAKFFVNNFPSSCCKEFWKKKKLFRFHNSFFFSLTLFPIPFPTLPACIYHNPFKLLFFSASHAYAPPS